MVVYVVRESQTDLGELDGVVKSESDWMSRWDPRVQGGVFSLV